MNQQPAIGTSKKPSFVHTSIIGNNQINNSHFILATVQCKTQRNMPNYISTSDKNRENKTNLKKYLIIEHHDKNILMHNDFNFKKIRKSYLLQQKLGMHCPGILPVYQIFDNENEKSFQVATKFTKKGILSTYLPGFAAYPNHMCTFHKLNPTRKSIIMYGIAQTMAFIHSNKIFFRDLSPDNIFLGEEYHPYITNFNRCIEKANDSTMQNDIFNYSIIYISLFGLIEIVQPDDDNSSISTLNNSQSDSIINILSSMKNGARPKLIDKISLTENQKSALMMMWDQNQKLTFSDIVQLFENGNLVFAGTNMEKFVNYQKTFKEEIYDYHNKLNEEIKEFCDQTNICLETVVEDND